MKFNLLFPIHWTLLVWFLVIPLVTLGADGVKIESIQGASTLNVTKLGKKREVKIGESVQSGERIVTNGLISATLIYPDGSRVVVSKNSDFAVEDNLDGTQWNKLRKGSVRGIIQKVTLPSSSKPRFLIRTKSAVLGVRGTDFVMALSSASGSAQVHTLEGLVDVARNEVSLLNGQATRLSEGQFLEASQSGLSTPQSFDKTEFLNSFNSDLSSSDNKSIQDTPKRELANQSNSSIQTVDSSPKIAVEAPVIPAPTRFKAPESPPSLLKDDKNEEKNQDEYRRPPAESPSRFKLLAFHAGIFFAQLREFSSPEVVNIRAVNAAWTPIIPVPFLTFLTIRGNLGGSFALQGSLNNNFLVKEAQIFLTLSVFNIIYGEVGTGRQFWQGERHFLGTLNTINAGLLIRLGLIDRLFIGYQSLDIHPKFDQYKAGIGISF